MREEKERPYYAQAIPVPETPRPRHNPPAWRKTKVIGKRLPARMSSPNWGPWNPSCKIQR